MSKSDPSCIVGTPALMLVAFALVACGGRETVTAAAQMEVDAAVLDRVVARHFDAYTAFRKQVEVRYVPTHRMLDEGADREAPIKAFSGAVPICSPSQLPAE